MAFDEDFYRSFFRAINGVGPYEFQIDVARRLTAGENLVLRAPTGSGKTATVLTPFLYPGWQPRPARLIYALPLRTLAQSIYSEAKRIVRLVGCDPQATVTIQTGEQPDDPFFDRGRIIVATYDQVLSGLLHGPYGLPGKLHNVNAAAMVGALVVFDEFHLMEPERAFLTGAAGLHLYRGLVQSVWMTATATEALANTLGEAIGALVAGPSDQEIESMPIVERVRRRMYWDSRPLSAEVVREHLDGRVVVLANTVRRAQAIYEELTERGMAGPAMLLHSRFFRSHRRDKELALHQMFGRGTREPALLIATQVVEAGVNISCDYLHTELAPMNSLVQRAGRCARFEDENGIVFVHPLPEEPRAWLPYGNLQQPEPALATTQALLEESGQGGVELTPMLAAQWVGKVHGEGDQRATEGLWLDRLRTIRDQIYHTAIARQPSRVTHLIREPATDEVGVILATANSLPARPGQREALTVRRWRLQSLVREAGGGERSVGWYWAVGDEPGWCPLTDEVQLLETFLVALDPTYARYTMERGLTVGESGEEQSPPRVEPRRPGHSPLHAEAWTAHVRAVADVAAARLEQDGAEGWLGERVGERFGLPAGALLLAARACALTHDLGKLQHGWQEWADASQKTRDPSYVHSVPLAHTDFDPSDPRDWEREKQVGVRRPDHSAAGAYVGVVGVSALVEELPADLRARVVSACAAAVLSHHGGWLQGDASSVRDLGIQRLCQDGPGAITEVFGGKVAKLVDAILSVADRRQQLRGLLDLTAGSDTLQDWWPLVGYLTRTLRLADQRATAEGGRIE